MAEQKHSTLHTKVIWAVIGLGFLVLMALGGYFLHTVQKVRSENAKQHTLKTNAIKGKVWMERATKAHEADNHDKEFELLLKSARFNYRPAILKISKNYETGNYVHQSDVKAREWAAKLPEAQYLKFLFRRGLDLTVSGKNVDDMTTGLKFLEEGLSLAPEDINTTLALNRLGWLYERGPESLQDAEKAQSVFEEIGGEGLANFWGSQGYEAEQLGDDLTARKYYQKAIDLGSDRAKISLAYNHLNDVDTEGSWEIADMLMKEAAKSENQNRQFEAAVYFVERGAQEDKDTGLELMDALAAAGLDKSSRYLAEYYSDNPNVEADYERAAKYIQGLTYIPAKAKVMLGHLKRTGTGTPQDVKAAFKLYQEAADESYDPAKIALAHMHRLGLGTPKDPAKAKALYEATRYDERHPASYYIGLMYERGALGAKGIKKAIGYYELAAEVEYGPAFIRLATHYETGEYVAQDTAKAFKLMTEAAYTAEPEAIENLARYYSEGIGTERSREYAAIWRSKKKERSPLAFD